MTHNTKINAIFVDVKAGDCSISVRRPCFLSCRCKIWGILSKFVAIYILMQYGK